MGVVGFGPNSRPIRRAACSPSPPRRSRQDLEIAGPIKLTLYASSTRSDTGFLRQAVGADAAIGRGPRRRRSAGGALVTKGWLQGVDAGGRPEAVAPARAALFVRRARPARPQPGLQILDRR